MQRRMYIDMIGISPGGQAPVSGIIALTQQILSLPTSSIDGREKWRAPTLLFNCGIFLLGPPYWAGSTVHTLIAILTLPRNASTDLIPDPQNVISTLNTLPSQTGCWWWWGCLRPGWSQPCCWCLVSPCQMSSLVMSHRTAHCALTLRIHQYNYNSDSLYKSPDVLMPS